MTDAAALLAAMPDPSAVNEHWRRICREMVTQRQRGRVRAGPARGLAARRRRPQGLAARGRPRRPARPAPLAPVLPPLPPRRPPERLPRLPGPDTGDIRAADGRGSRARDRGRVTAGRPGRNPGAGATADGRSSAARASSARRARSAATSRTPARARRWPRTRTRRSRGRPFRELSLAALVREGVPPPELLCGDLLYAGGLHSIAGPPDCGKTTIALWWMLQHVRAGQTVMFLDEEGGAELVAEKLIALGATPEEVARIRYYPFPARAWNAYDVIVLRELLDDIKPGIVLWDSSAAFLSRAGLDENSAGDVTRFWSQVLTPIAREHGAAVLVIDHDVKNGEASRFARGSGAKLAADRRRVQGRHRPGVRPDHERRPAHARHERPARMAAPLARDRRAHRQRHEAGFTETTGGRRARGRSS